jgi:hypothetical protein
MSDNVMGYDMAEPVQLRILPNNGSGWYWEVINQDREVITGGFSDSHIQARTDAMNAGLDQRPQEIHRTGVGRLRWRMIWSAVSQATDKMRSRYETDYGRQLFGLPVLWATGDWSYSSRETAR